MSLRPFLPTSPGRSGRGSLRVMVAVAAGFVAISVLAGCGTSSDSDSATTGGDIDFEATTWRIDAVDAVEPPLMVPSEVTATLRFEDGTVSGSTGCNSVFGPYTYDEGVLALGPLGSTLRACQGPAGDVEAAVLSALKDAAGFSRDGAVLTLVDGFGNPLLTFEAVADLSLASGEWAATGINNGTGGVASLVAGTTVTATFGNDGSVTGSAGCNTFMGSYTDDGSTLAISELATTRKLCEADVMKQETAYLAALKAATTMTFGVNALELRDGDGALQVGYALSVPASS